MTHLYHVQMTNGALYEVGTNEDHNNQSERSFRQHLRDIIATMDPEVTLDEVVRFDREGSSENTVRLLVDLP